jgi:hypothetical protein
MFEAEIWHTPMVRLRDGAAAYGGLFVGACSCSWASDRLQTTTGAWKAARDHALNSNDALMLELMIDGAQSAPPVEGLPDVQGLQVQGPGAGQAETDRRAAEDREEAPRLEGGPR